MQMKVQMDFEVTIAEDRVNANEIFVAVKEACKEASEKLAVAVFDGYQERTVDTLCRSSVQHGEEAHFTCYPARAVDHRLHISPAFCRTGSLHDHKPLRDRDRLRVNHSNLGIVDQPAGGACYLQRAAQPLRKVDGHDLSAMVRFGSIGVQEIRNRRGGGFYGYFTLALPGINFCRGDIDPILVDIPAHIEQQGYNPDIQFPHQFRGNIGVRISNHQYIVHRHSLL